MKVIHYEREAKGPHRHIMDMSWGSYFYVPDKEVVLFSDQNSFSRIHYSLSNQKELLEEARAIASGRTPEVDGVEYKNIKTVEYDGSQLQGLIEDIKSRNELDRKIKPDIEELLQQVK